ncbi:MAG TPA: tyrosine-type recombinase/integrase [Sphaerochaeta sp.]|nr:tyrosine-type recombinase/integrase [Sphaerochaeta sp.]
MTAQGVRDLAKHLVEEDMIARRLGQTTRKMTHAGGKEFFRWITRRGTGDLRLIGKKDLVAYHAYLVARKSKKSGEPLEAHTINAFFRSAVLIFSILYRAGVIPENPAHGLTLDIPIPSGMKRRPLTRDEITRFLESIETDTRQGLKDRTLFELIYSSGLRVAEAASLKVCDIDFDRREMVVRGKFDRDRMVPISTVARDFLLTYLGEKIRTPDAWVFVGYGGPTHGRHIASTSISERFRTLLRRFDMDKKEISTHSIRHSTATHLLENGASIRHVQELLGHHCIESTVRYTHVMIDTISRVYRKYHPREHELFEAVDAEYDKRLDSLLVRKKKEC